MIKNIRVTVDGKPFDVTVEIPDEAQPATPAPAPVPTAVAAQAPSVSAPASEAAPAAAGEGDVPSPLAGHVVGISATVGQPVKQGDPLLSIEAMKMNTFVLAPKDGQVTAINVKVGDVVSEGQALVHIK